LKPALTVYLVCAVALFVLAQSAAASQGRDLVIDPNALDPFIEQALFDGSHCAVEEGCTQPGTRTLLRFRTRMLNIGDTDIVLGPPTDPNLFEFQACHGHSHYGDFIEAALLDQANQFAASVKQGFCLLDTARFDPNSNPFPTYDCNNQGLSAGWADIYSPSLDCQWLDITGFPGGTYTLRLTVNPSQSTVLEDPNGFGNNTVEIEVVLPALPGEGVPTLPRWGLFLFAALLLLSAALLTRRAGLRPDAVMRRAAPVPRPRANR
jgi:hypothetical protein